MTVHPVPASRLRPRKTPVQPRAVETRDRILAAAARVFSRHGYAAGTTNRIAAEAGLSVGSLYQYLPDKEAIVEALAGVLIADALLQEAFRSDARGEAALIGEAKRVLRLYLADVLARA